MPWLQLIDAALGLANFARGSKAPSPPPDEPSVQLESGGRPGSGLEARLAGVVVAALKEAFDRDARRLELEREQLAAERQRAERALQLELRRQAADREIGRLRLLAAVAVIAFLGTLFLSSRLIAGGIGARGSLGVGWLFLLGAIAASFAAQSRAASVVAGTAADGDSRSSAAAPAAPDGLVLTLLLGGLVFVGVAALLV